MQHPTTCTPWWVLALEWPVLSGSSYATVTSYWKRPRLQGATWQIQEDVAVKTWNVPQSTGMHWTIAGQWSDQLISRSSWPNLSWSVAKSGGKTMENRFKRLWKIGCFFSGAHLELKKREDSIWCKRNDIKELNLLLLQLTEAFRKRLKLQR